MVFAVFVDSTVLFLRWFHRAYSNLPALRSQPRFKRRWAIGGWFVPILWLWWPKLLRRRGRHPR